MEYRKIIGQQGRWTVTVTWMDGTQQELPTAHLEFIDWPGHSYQRNDLGRMRDYPGKFAHWEATLRQSRKVVVTKSRWTEGEGSSAKGRPTREGYIAIFDVETVHIEEDQIELKLGQIHRLSSLVTR